MTYFQISPKTTFQPNLLSGFSFQGFFRSVVLARIHGAVLMLHCTFIRFRSLSLAIG
jgi:hypothetical protein